MPKERRPFSLLGHTRWEKVRNIAGLIMIVGFVASKYINLDFERISTVEIAASSYGIKSEEALRSSVQSFQPSEGSLSAVAKTIQSSVPEIKENVTVSFVVGKAPTFALVIECTSQWPKEKLAPVCASFGSDFKMHLASASGKQ